MIARPTIGRYDCIFCLNPGQTLLMKLDKNGKPYVTCTLCLVRVFFHTDASLTGLRKLWGFAFSMAERAMPKPSTVPPTTAPVAPTVQTGGG